MVHCNTLLLASGILLGIVAAFQAPEIDVRQHIGLPGNSQIAAGESITPIHRVALIVDPVKGLSDPLVIKLYNRSLAQKTERKRKRSFPRPKLPGGESTGPTFALPGNLPEKPLEYPAERINAEQLMALADLYLTGSLTDRLISNFRITVLDHKEVESALTELHLSQSQASESNGARKLCSRLDCDAVLVIGVPVLSRQDDADRELVLRTTIHLAGIREHNNGFVPVHKPASGAETVVAARVQGSFAVSGDAVASRAFMHSGYNATYAELSQQAATQAASIALHTLSTSETAPFMSAGTRIAVAPTYGSDRADLLVFSSSGRHTELDAVKPLPTNLSGFFKPQLLPVMKANRIDSAGTFAAMREIPVSHSDLWRDQDKPNTEAVLQLAKKLKVQYVIIAHITDIEVSTAPFDDDENHKIGTIKLETPTDALKWQREAHAEASGALVRTQDGVVIWTDRGNTTVSSRDKATPGESASANRLIAMDAEKFALIDLVRRFAGFRSQFEQ